MNKTEAFFESLMFKSRWLLAPFFFGLIIAIVVLLLKFGKQLFLLFGMLSFILGLLSEQISTLRKEVSIMKTRDEG